jgi:hypothetical protein
MRIGTSKHRHEEDGLRPSLGLLLSNFCLSCLGRGSTCLLVLLACIRKHRGDPDERKCVVLKRHMLCLFYHNFFTCLLLEGIVDRRIPVRAC